MKRFFVCILCHVLCLQLWIVSVVAGECPDKFNADVPIAGMMIQLVNHSVCAFEKKFGKNQKLLSEIQTYKSETDGKLSRVLNELTKTVKLYSENENFEDSSFEFLVKFEELNNKIYETLLIYPDSDDVQEVISPIVHEFEQVLFNQFPKIQDPSDKSPLGGLFNFFHQTESENPFGLAPFFQFFFPKERGLKQVVEVKESVTEEGIKTESVLFRQEDKFIDAELVFHETIVNDEVIDKFEKIEDLTVFHGLPAQMREDGVNELVVSLIEEYLNLINYRLDKTQEELGIIVNLNHPQVQIPSGYSSDQFITNFVNILHQLAG